MCPCVGLEEVPTYWSYLLAAVAALVIAPSSTTPSWTVPGKETILEDFKETTAAYRQQDIIPGEVTILPTLATARITHDFFESSQNLKI